jgi:predicted component of type VI protein secretion system
MSVCHNVLAVGQPDGSLTIDEETIPPPLPIAGVPWLGEGGWIKLTLRSGCVML